MKNRFISIIFLSFIALSSILFFILAFVIWLFTFLFDRRLVLLHLYSSFWASLYLWIMPAWSVSVKGRNKYKKKTTYMLVSNHQSQLDILVAFSLFLPFKWVSKAEIFRIPFIGWNMVLNRYIKLKRGNKESIKKMMDDCEKMISEGNSIYFFPEGTRSKNGIIKPFKTGAFILAKKMKIPILPIAISGTTNALPKHSLNFHGHHKISIEVLDEVPYEKFKDLSSEETGEFIRRIIAEQVDEHTESI